MTWAVLSNEVIYFLFFKFLLLGKTKNNINCVYDADSYAGSIKNKSDTTQKCDYDIQFIETWNMDNVGTYSIESTVLVPHHGTENTQ